MMNVKKFVTSQRTLMGHLINYSIMVMENLTELRQIMNDTTNSLMDGVSRINDAKTFKEKMATAVLISAKEKSTSHASLMQGDDANFKNADHKTALSLKSAAELSSSCVASLVFKEAMKGFDDISSEIENSVMQIVGAMSADDVVGQRMNHVRDNLAALNRFLVKYKEVIPSHHEVALFKDELKEIMQKSHVMLEEQAVFNEVFNHKKDQSHLTHEYRYTQEFIDFISDYFHVLENQLREVVSQIGEALSLSGELIMGISSTTEEGKAKAEAELENAYSSNSGETSELVDAVQADIDDIFEKIQNGEEVESDHMADKRRLLGHFSKHMESLSTLDEAVSQVVMESMGALSSEDVLKQRLENMVKCLRLVRQKLVSTDVDNYENDGYVDRLIEDMKQTSLNMFVSNEERHIHKKYLS